MAALKTGEGDEERVEEVVAKRFIEEHEGYGRQFLWGAGTVFGLAILVLALPGRAAARWTKVVLVAASVTVAGLGIRAVVSL